MSEEYFPEDSDARDAQRTQDVREAQVTEAMDRETEIAQLHVLLGDEGMRDFLWRVLSKCNVFASTYSKVYGDMALNEGKRTIGLWLLSELAEANPDALLTMQTKANRLAQAQAQSKRRRAARRERREPTSR